MPTATPDATGSATPGSSRGTVTPRLVQRRTDPALIAQGQALGLTALQARLLAGRVNAPRHELSALVKPSLRHLVDPDCLKDGARAAERIARAVAEGEQIGILTDYDVDGITSHVVILRTLVELFGVPEKNIHSLIGHRINDGYGISRPLVERTLSLSPKPSLIISADCGSSDEARIALLKEGGIDVVVTDHHAVPVEGPPASAYAVVNPSRLDCNYPDATIAGCMVSWLIMSLARSRFGGHAGAAGLTLVAEQREAFGEAVEQAVAEQLNGRELFPIIMTDGELEPDQLNLGLLDEIEALGPYGREFESPQFEGHFLVTKARLVGSEGTHLMLELAQGDASIRGIWFRAVKPGETAPFEEGTMVHCAYKPARNRFRGRESLQLIVEYAAVADA